MWNRLSKQTAVELEQLDRLIETHRPLLTKCASETPSNIELSALAAMLHSFYTGIENIFKRVEVELDGDLPQGEFWHRELLKAMTRPREEYRLVIPGSLRDQLREYLEFRHVFRQAYTFQLQWEKMASLVLNCERVFRSLEAELGTFFQTDEQDK